MNQMCYCYRKLGNLTIFNVFLGGRVRPWEAVWGRAPLIGLEICPSQSGEHGLTQPLTASHFRPHTASHRLGLTQFVMWSVWANQGSTASHAHGLSDLWGRGSPRCRSASHAHRSDSGRSNAFSREISQASPRIVLPRPVCVRGRSAPRTPTASQIWESEVGGRGRPSTASHYKVMWSVWESEVRGRVGGRSASHAHRASRTSTGRGSTILGLTWLISRLNALLRPVEVRLARCAWEADRPPTRPLTSDSQTDHTASQIGLTDRTLWQIWLSDRSDRLDWS